MATSSHRDKCGRSKRGYATPEPHRVGCSAFVRPVVLLGHCFGGSVDAGTTALGVCTFTAGAWSGSAGAAVGCDAELSGEVVGAGTPAATLGGKGHLQSKVSRTKANNAMTSPRKPIQKPGLSHSDRVTDRSTFSSLPSSSATWVFSSSAGAIARCLSICFKRWSQATCCGAWGANCDFKERSSASDLSLWRSRYCSISSSLVIIKVTAFGPNVV